MGDVGMGRGRAELFPRRLVVCGMTESVCVCVCLTDQSGQRAVRDGGREADNDEVLVVAQLLHLHTLLRHHVQLLQGVGLLRVPDGPNHI